jgi:hypothetical protein
MLVGRGVAGRGEGAARGSGGVGCVVVRSRVVVADRGALAAGVPRDRAAGADRGTPDDRDGDLRSVDGAQGALPVGVSVVGGGGVRLDSSASVLPDFAVRAGAGRVDGAQADPADRRGDGVRAHARVDREGVSGEAVSPAGGAGRLDGDRGRREVPDRRRAGVEWGAGPGPGGAQAGEVDRREEGAGAGSLAVDGPQAAGDQPDDSSAFRGGEGRGAEADRRDRRAACPVAEGSAPACGAGQAQGAGGGARRRS